VAAQIERIANPQETWSAARCWRAPGIFLGISFEERGDTASALIVLAARGRDHNGKMWPSSSYLLGAARLRKREPYNQTPHGLATWQAERAAGDHDRNTLRLRLDPERDASTFEPGMRVWLVR
jgi:hypothetical protein